MANEEINKAWHHFIMGDRQAFGKIYQYYFPMLTMYCLGKIKDLGEAENCASESLLKTMNYDKPEEIRDLEAWLFRIARNVCLTFMSKNSRRQDIVKEIHSEKQKYTMPEVDRQEKWNEYEKVLRENVKEPDRQIWKMHLEGFNNEEIARELNMNEKTVANRKSEVRKILRGLLKELN